MDVPETSYARSGDVSIAYQVVGEAPVDLIIVHGFVSNVEFVWQAPEWHKFVEKLASFARVLMFDKRGVGLSDRVRGVPTLEERMDDVRAVMDAAGSQAATVFGSYQGAAMSILFAATYPERVRALVLWGPIPREAWAPDYEWGVRPKEFREAIESIENEWGGRAPARWWVERIAPSKAQDESFVRWFGSFLRMSASPGAAAAIWRMDWEIDVRHILPSVSVPTLVLSREYDKGPSRYVAERIAGARYRELPGDDSLYIFDEDDVIEAIREFAERPHAVAASAVVATVLSRTSFVLLRSQPRAATLPGGNCSASITRLCVRSWRDSAALRSTPATASLPGSTAPPVRFAARARSVPRWRGSGSGFVPVYTRASANSSTVNPLG